MKFLEKVWEKHDTERVPNERQERTRVRQELILTRWRHKMSTDSAFSARATGNHAHQRTWSPQVYWFMVYRLWFMVYCLLVYGLSFMVYGLWFMVYGLWFMVY